MTIPPVCVTAAQRAVRWSCGFFEMKADQSMTRAVTLICALSGLICALAAYRVATRPHLDSSSAQVIAALTGLASAFVAAGCVALAKRTKITDVATATGDTHAPQ
jgi:drug/metabolite transporter (DMT)-like permease